MIRIMRRLLAFAGKEKGNILSSFFWSIIESILEMLPIMAILTVFSGMLSTMEGNAMPLSSIWISLVLMLISIIGKIIAGNLSCTRRTYASFSMCTAKRLEIGEKMKRVHMGWFSDNRPGEIAALVTTLLGDIETNAVMILEKTAGGFIHAFVIGTWLLFYDWHIGLLMISGIAVSLLVYALIQKSGKKHSPRRQSAQSALVTEILEYVKGMGVVKSFGLGGRSNQAVRRAIDESRDANIALEVSFSNLSGLYHTVFKVAQAALLILVPYLLSDGQITAEKSLLLLVSGFMIYSGIELAGSMTSVARVIESSLDRLETITDMPILDRYGREVTPQNHDIELEHVSFSYDKDDVIHDVSLKIPERTTCALVGPSGSGKTTLISLVARFWDVDEGSIRLGGRDVREYTCDSLLRNFSIVFQNVYLFEDTIENNIRFGCPEASMEMVEEASRKACCHDFIMELPDGYRTKVGESGATLSGGERQRISIARAILKDAPIIILDEATASVDPENEQLLQSAIAELTRNKTILMIAHRLTTIRNADRIVVLDKGRITEQGTHAELMKRNGLYHRFVKAREEAIDWKLDGRNQEMKDIHHSYTDMEE